MPLCPGWQLSATPVLQILLSSPSLYLSICEMIYSTSV